MPEQDYFVYIMASRSLTLYIGFSNQLAIRVKQHKDGVFEGFSRTYNCTRLVYFERHQYVDNAISREKQLKRWSRAKKIALIKSLNPTWLDLSEDWGQSLRIFHAQNAQ
jgi:putative endonuclease